jgi:WD repeat-containing protein 61
VFVLNSEYKLHDAPVYGLAISENIAFTAAADKTVKSIDLSSGIIQSFTVRSEVSPISLWAISPELLAIGYLNGEFYLINPRTRSTIFEYHFSGDGVFSLYSFNDTELYIGLGSGRLAILDFVRLDWIYLEQVSTDKIRTMVYDAHSHCCYIGAKDGDLLAFDVTDYAVNVRWHAHDGGVNSLLFTSTNLLISGGKDGHIRVWNNQECLHAIPAHRGVIYGIIEVGAYLVSCSRDKSIKVWEMETLKPLQKITFHRQSVNQLVQQNAHSFVTASDDHRIALWEYAE